MLVCLFHSTLTDLVHIFYMDECLTFYSVQDAGVYIPTSASDEGIFFQFTVPLTIFSIVQFCQAVGI